MGVLALLAVVVVAVFYGGFKLSVGRAGGGSAPTADVVGGFTQVGNSLGFAVAVPAGIPSDWHPNSFSVTEKSAGGPPAAARGGWLTPDGNFVTLVQSAGAPADVQQAELGSSGAATGTVNAGGNDWTVVPGRRSEAAWIRPSADGQFRYLITGNASAADFQVLAAAVAGH